jgi:hypothetical protein
MDNKTILNPELLVEAIKEPDCKPAFSLRSINIPDKDKVSQKPYNKMSDIEKRNFRLCCNSYDFIIKNKEKQE